MFCSIEAVVRSSFEYQWWYHWLLSTNVWLSTCYGYSELMRRGLVGSYSTSSSEFYVRVYAEAVHVQVQLQMVVPWGVEYQFVVRYLLWLHCMPPGKFGV